MLAKGSNSERCSLSISISLNWDGISLGGSAHHQALDAWPT